MLTRAFINPLRLGRTSIYFATPVAAVLVALPVARDWPSSFLATLICLAAFALILRWYLFRHARSHAKRNQAFAGELLKNAPTSARIFVDQDIEAESEVSVVQPGHLVRVNPEEIVPVDGFITFGSSFVDESVLTGRTEPVAVSVGSPVFGGTLNKNGSFIYRAAATASESAPARVRNLLVKESFVRFRFPVALELFLVALAAIALSRQQHLLSSSLLLVSVAAPLDFLWQYVEQTFLAQSAAMGFFWKTGAAPSLLSRANTVLFEPQNFLTTGKYALADVKTANDFSENAALRHAAPLARKLDTSIAQAVLLEQRLRNIPLEPVEDYAELTGGVRGQIDGTDTAWVISHHEKFVAIEDSAFKEEIASAVREGHTVTLLLINNQLKAALMFSEQLSPGFEDSLRTLREERVEPILMLSPINKDKETILKAAPPAGLHFTQFQEEKDLENVVRTLRSNGMKPIWLSGNDGPAPASSIHCDEAHGGVGVNSHAFLHLWRASLVDFALARRSARKLRLWRAASVITAIFAETICLALIFKGFPLYAIPVHALFVIVLFFFARRY